MKSKKKTQLLKKKQRQVVSFLLIFLTMRARLSIREKIRSRSGTYRPKESFRRYFLSFKNA